MNPIPIAWFSLSRRPDRALPLFIGPADHEMAGFLLAEAAGMAEAVATGDSEVDDRVGWILPEGCFAPVDLSPARSAGFVQTRRPPQAVRLRPVVLATGGPELPVSNGWDQMRLVDAGVAEGGAAEEE